MTEVPDRVRRAFRDREGFEPAADPGVYEAVTTPFAGAVAVADRGEGAVGFEVTVRVPTLAAAVAGEVAPVVEDGWYETFELRIADAGDVTRAGRDLDPSVRRTTDEVIVEVAYADRDPRRGVDDAMALVNFVEGTYVQGIIPGYEYEEPVAGLLASARRAADTGD